MRVVAAEDAKDRRIAELERQLAERDRRIERLERKIDRLERLIEELQRSAKRQAGPFSRGAPEANPKRRGRKKGKRYGKQGSRAIPAKIDRVVHVGAPLFCPRCHRPAKLIGTIKQWQTDLPRAQAVTTEFQIDVSQCTRCGRKLRRRHRDQISDATGAAGVQIGPHAIAFAAKLNKECGVSYERIANIFDKGFGLVCDRSTLNRALGRLAKVLEPAYETIAARVRASSMLSPDETGWKTGGHKAWLHTAATREETLYMITRGRGRAEAAKLIGRDYRGTIVRDGHIGYRGKGVFPHARSQSCLRHILRRIGGLIDLPLDPLALRWLEGLAALFREAIRTRDQRDQARISGRRLAETIVRLEGRLDRMLRRCPDQPACRRLAKHLRCERRALLTFLYQDAIPATNYLAEQALRPAVVNRKMSAGNNTPHGARTQEVLMTVLHTAHKRGLDALSIATDALRDPPSASAVF